MPLGLLVVLCLVIDRAHDGSMGKSPHVRYDPSEISTTLDDVKGIGPVKDEVVKTPQPLPRPTRPSARAWAARRARACCSRARPAPARPTWPRRWRARRACRSCSCRRPRSSRCTTAQTNRKIRSYFKALRKAARPRRAAPSASSRRSTPSARARSGMGGVDAPGGHRRRRQRAAHPAAVVRRRRPARPRSPAGSSTRLNRLPAGAPAAAASPRPDRQRPRDRRPPTAPPTSTPRCCARVASTARSTSTSRAGPVAARSSTTTSTRRRTTPSSTRTSGATRWPR